MTETEWLEDTDPQEMLEHLRPELTERKARLLAASWCRCIWPLLEDPRSRNAIEVAERYADGLASAPELRSAYDSAFDSYEDYPIPTGPNQEVPLEFKTFSIARQSTSFLVRESDEFLLDCFLCVHKALLRWDLLRAVPGQRVDDYYARVRILRDLIYEVIGNPIRPAALTRAWLIWSDGIVPRLAQAIYEDRQMPSGGLDPVRLAVLADALEDAGCDNTDIFSHCRKPGRHVRGCWVLDLILGKV
jgi:hypothetical protein